MLTLPLLGPSCLLISHFPPVFDCARASTRLIHGCVMPTFIWWPLCVSDFDLVDAWLSVFVSQPPVDGSPPLQIKHIHRDWQFRWYDLRCQHQRLKFFFRGEPQLRWRRWWRLVLRRQGRTELAIAGNALSKRQNIVHPRVKIGKFDRFQLMRRMSAASECD